MSRLHLLVPLAAAALLLGCPDNPEPGAVPDTVSQDLTVPIDGMEADDIAEEPNDTPAEPDDTPQPADVPEPVDTPLDIADEGPPPNDVPVVEPGCVVFDGACDAAIPENPWWYWDGEGCVKNDTCMCEGCPGTFVSLAACEQTCLTPDCPAYITALADCAYGLTSEATAGACPETVCRDSPCQTDADCPLADAAEVGGSCVQGNCTYCWQDSQCGADQLCRGGRCVESPKGCGTAPVCDAVGCKLTTPSEVACPVCVCDSTFSPQCKNDMDCQVLSIFPYKACVYGHCAQCRNNADCASGPCLAPGVCFDMKPHPEAIYGTWLVGWFGGLDHFGFMRFEPDGTLRRGQYTPTGTFMDDFPPFPCAPPDGIHPAALGTWEPEITASGFLVVKLRLNISCDAGQGWTARYGFTLSEDGQSAALLDIDSMNSLNAVRVSGDKCADDFTWCEPPTGADFGF